MAVPPKTQRRFHCTSASSVYRTFCHSSVMAVSTELAEEAAGISCRGKVLGDITEEKTLRKESRGGGGRGGRGLKTLVTEIDHNRHLVLVVWLLVSLLCFLAFQQSLHTRGQNSLIHGIILYVTWNLIGLNLSIYMCTYTFS
eukprot:GHVS01042556.1.p1 GENE.GHVS01042556.1~~GHVS01042556.1.p1  ORF type:complete len:150 (-),score=11.02 GHVS01042556.1:98-523(-)